MIEDTERNFPFTVEGESFDSTQKEVTAFSIMEQAQRKGITAARGEIENLTLKGRKAIYSNDDLVDLSQDNDFTLGLRVYKFKVNGQELESSMEKLVASDIIKLADEKGVPIPSKPENLLLESLGEEKEEFKLDEWVDLEKFNNFILIVNEPTPVA